MLSFCDYSHLDTDNRALLGAVEQFVEAEITPRWKKPETPLICADLLAIQKNAETAGLLDASAEGYGLWAELITGRPRQFSVQALRALARGNSAAAYHLHVLALAHAAHTLADGPALPSGTTLALSGTLGLGRASLIRWLKNETSPADLRLLADVYGYRERILMTAVPDADRLIPLFDSENMVLALYPRATVEASPDAQPHGLDGLTALTWRPRQSPAWTTALPKPLFLRLLAAYQLGLVAIALGASERAGELAHHYVVLRVQGGRKIIHHDAVSALIADQDAALMSVSAQLTEVAERVDDDNFPAILSFKQEGIPLLCRAVNASMQVHGGSGYMRDTGVENVLRDINCLRMMGGTPLELALMITAWRFPQAAQPIEACDAQTLPGFVPAHSPLSPLAAFKKLPILRRLAAYEPKTPWERETAELPSMLARYRRQMREFADTHLRPLALKADVAMNATTQRPASLDTLLSEAGRAGLLSDLLPIPFGSVPLPRFRYALAWQQAIRTEELARADGGLMLYLSAHNLGLAPIIFSGNVYALRQIVIPALRACKRGEPQIFAFAITEPAAGSDAEEGHGALHNKPGLVARRVAGGWRLTGRKVFISGGDIARWVVAFAALAGEGFESWTAFLVDTQSPGFTRVRNEHKMGMRASSATELAFDDCLVSDRLVLGGLRNGWALNRATLNFSRLPVAGMAVGFAQQATELASDFACRMTLGGRPLIHYQNVQLAIADMQAETAAIRALVWQFAQAWTPWQAKASIAKFYATDQAQRVIERALDLFGEYGVLHASEVEKTFRDNRLTRIFEGTNQINRLAVIEDQQQHFLACIARHHHRGGQ